jgi:archaellum component FlaC
MPKSFQHFLELRTEKLQQGFLELKSNKEQFIQHYSQSKTKFDQFENDLNQFVSFPNSNLDFDKIDSNLEHLESELNELQQESEQVKSIIQTIKDLNQSKSRICFVLPLEQKNQIKEWNSLQILFDDFQIINNQLSKLKSETNTLYIHPKISSFEEKCFQEFKMKTISIPLSITLLQFSCFYKCSNLIEVSLPDSITSLGKDCFRECSSLKQIILSKSLTSLSIVCFQT